MDLKKKHKNSYNISLITY